MDPMLLLLFVAIAVLASSALYIRGPVPQGTNSQFRLVDDGDAGGTLIGRLFVAAAAVSLAIAAWFVAVQGFDLPGLAQRGQWTAVTALGLGLIVVALLAVRTIRSATWSALQYRVLGAGELVLPCWPLPLEQPVEFAYRRRLKQRVKPRGISAKLVCYTRRATLSRDENGRRNTALLPAFEIPLDAVEPRIRKGAIGRVNVPSPPAYMEQGRALLQEWTGFDGEGYMFEYHLVVSLDFAAEALRDDSTFRLRTAD